MSVLEQYHQEAKLLHPTELRIRKINEIRDKIRTGEQLTAEQHETAFKPVTSELIKMQDIIHKLTKKQETLPIYLSETSPERLLDTKHEAIQETPSASYIKPSSIDQFLNDKFAPAFLSKYNLPTPFEMFSYHENDETGLEHLGTISKELGRQKSKSSGPKREEIDREIDMIRKYRYLHKALQGTGLFYYKYTKDLIDRLKILMGQMKVGNDSVDIQNEALTILDKLLQQKKISKEDHEKLYEKIYSF